MSDEPLKIYKLTYSSVEK